jgi:RHS repeat-associated protein
MLIALDLYSRRNLMKLSRHLVSFVVLLAAVATPGTHAWRITALSANQPPVANDDTYTRHGSGTIGPVLANDSDPDGDPMTASLVTTPGHGSLSGIDGNSFFYTLINSTFVGTDTFSYRACDNHSACSNIAVVTINVVNQPPVAGDDSYTAHGITNIGPMLVNDSDPDGEQILYVQVTQPGHGALTGLNQPDMQQYRPNFGYVGPDSFIYKACDQFNLCSAPATVTISVNDNPPVAEGEFFVARGITTIGPLLANDVDPDGGDQLFYAQLSGTSHGTVFGLTVPDIQSYHPDQGYVGADSFNYKVCDQLGACSPPVTVTLYVPGDGENDGLCNPCNSSVGGPVNVTNGNMYLQQNDHSLPSTGPAINITRTYNSDSQSTGLFGRSWRTAYDKLVTVFDSNLLRLNQADGRSIYFGRAVGSSGGFTALEGDFHGQVTQGNGGFTLSMKDGSVHQFNPAGKLLSMSDRNGNSTSLAYDSNGFLSSVTDPFGRVLTLTTNANGQVLSISDTIGTIASYTYGAGNVLLSVTYADNSALQFSYDGANRLTTVTDALGNMVESHTYDAQGRALTSEEQGGVEHYSLSYVSDTETDVTDGLGRVTKYTFDTSKGRNVVTQVEGDCSCGSGGAQVRTWTYDNQLNVTAKTDALGHVTSYTYDGNGNRLTETDAVGTVTYTYNGFAEVLTHTDQMNGVTTNAYDGLGDLLSSTDARGKTTDFAYDARGLLLSITDARGKITGFAYDASDNLISKTDALSHAAQFAYDARSRLTSTTNTLGNVTTFGYDAVGRLTQVTQADGTFITYEYDLAGRRTAITDAKGNRSTYAYDGANRLISETDALNHSTAYSYDSMSNLTARSDALSRVTNYDYDDFNRLAKITHPPATTGATRLFETIEYDAGGNVTKRIDTAGRATQYQYDSVNRLSSVTGPASQVTQYEYNARSEMTTLLDAIGQRYRFNYNSVGQVTHLRRGTGVLTFTYDPVGNRKTRTDYNGTLTDYTYDALNRLKTISYPGAKTVNYTYDKLSRLQMATNENGIVNFDYDKMSRLTSATDVFGQVVNYNYDANGNRTKLSLNAATVATYRYDGLNRLTKLLDATGLTTTYSYDATNKLTSRRLPNGVLSSYLYDGMDRLTRLLDAKSVATVADHQYQYNTASQIAQIAGPTNTHSYSYDSLDRLSSTSYTNPLQTNESYAYDSVGNRTSSHLSATYGYQPFNRMTSTSSATFTYDQNGNLLSKTNSSGTTQYLWDFENRLRQVTLPNGNTVSYKYDALGRRAQRAPSAGASTNFIYDGQDVAKDLNSDGSTVDYLNGPGVDNKLRLTDSRLAATGPLYFLQNHLGSTTALTNSLGVVTSQINYDAFGNPTTSASLTRYTYTGREFDSDTGLYYYRARWYDPQVGRFISEDPIGLTGGVNAFAYVGDNPQNAVDPSGLYEIDVHYYLTYFLALKTGCFTDPEAREIANADQGVDDNPATSPAYGDTERQRQVNAFYHGLHPGSHQPYLDAHSMNATMGRNGSLSGLGIYLHYLQDTFSHQGFTDPRYGHGSGTHAVDKTDEDIPKAMRMAGSSWDALNKFAGEKKCGCHGAWDPSLEKQVGEFSRASGGGLVDRRLYSIEQIDPRFLNNKISILGVGRR